MDSIDPFIIKKISTTIDLFKLNLHYKGDHDLTIELVRSGLAQDENSKNSQYICRR